VVPGAMSTSARVILAMSWRDEVGGTPIRAASTSARWSSDLSILRFGVGRLLGVQTSAVLCVLPHTESDAKHASTPVAHCQLATLSRGRLADGPDGVHCERVIRFLGQAGYHHDP
jgi:hypothetical protein